ncbi:MAG: hypothetical protein ACRCS9_06985 [Hyphomicrobium sp.]
MTHTKLERAAYELAETYFREHDITDYLDGELDQLADKFMTLIETYAEMWDEAGHSLPVFTS